MEIRWHLGVRVRGQLVQPPDEEADLVGRLGIAKCGAVVVRSIVSHKTLSLCALGTPIEGAEMR